MIIITPGDLAHTVRERRKQMRLSQAALAKRAGVSRTWLAELEQGKATAEIGLVLNTLLALGLRVDVRDGAPDATAAGILTGVAAPDGTPVRRLRTSRALWRRPGDVESGGDDEGER